MTNFTPRPDRDGKYPDEVDEQAEEDEPEDAMSLGVVVGVVPEKVGEHSEGEVVVVAIGTVEKGNQGHDKVVICVISGLLHIYSLYVILNLLHSMKEENEKTVELSKLRKLEVYPLDRSFVTGYLAYAMPEDRLP